MKSWPAPFLPDLPGRTGEVRIYDTAAQAVVPLAPGPVARMYVCGITPYDATHLGHAATYVTFDLLGRVLRDTGREVRYVQNVTDVDEPLFERAARDGVDWRDLATSEIDLFRDDMTALAVIPPDDYVGVVESVDLIAADVARLVTSGAAYAVPVGDGEGEDIYLDVSAQPTFGEVSHDDRARMLDLFAERGGDPQRPGKRDALDPLLWRAARPGEPSWDHPTLGAGRPGWHVECTAIASDRLGMPFDVQGGGTDLIFPHHEMSAVQGRALHADVPFASAYVHQAMVGYAGEKMSKSLGNLVLVSQLRAQGVDAMAIRLVLLAQHYRTEWHYTQELLAAAQARLDRWRQALSVNEGPAAEPVLAAVRAALADDLDAPAALAAVDAWATESLERGGATFGAPGIVARACDALLGVRL